MLLLSRKLLHEHADKAGWHTFNIHKYIQPFQISRQIN